MKNDENLHKWINGELSPEELEVFKLRPEYESLVELYKRTDRLAVKTPNEEAMLQAILNEKKEETVKPEAIGRRTFLPNFLKYAAAALIVLSVGWYFLSSPKSSTNYKVAKAEKLNGQLPDGSTFVLNADSELNFDAASWETERNLNLKGEVFFSVKKGKTFSVLTKNGSVEVVGTAFNVISRNEILEVACMSGSVRVKSIKGAEVGTLQKNEALRINTDSSVEKWEAESAAQPSWIEGLTKFKKEPLFVVLSEIERQYDVKIDANKINSTEVISCNFQHEDLELALKTTLSMLGISYEIKGKDVILTKKD